MGKYLEQQTYSHKTCGIFCWVPREQADHSLCIVFIQFILYLLLLSFLGTCMLDAQAQGCILKSRSLEKVLKSSDKMEAKLIGYDETPIDLENVSVEESFGCNSYSEPRSTGEAFNGSSISKSIRRLCPSPPALVRRDLGQTIDNHVTDTDSETSGTIFYLY